ncbi:MAG: DUF2845 domain-containing protein [Deltaproteobacteria bacterium]|nr:DUF2845 domain-containing protein [Deltaproteobacteria bacterium]
MTEMKMQMEYGVFLIFTCLLIVFAGSASAIAGANFRCGGRIIAVGATRDYVLEKCGEPTSIEERTEGIARGFMHRYPEGHEELKYVLGKIQVEVWTYNLGSTQFIRYLTFRNGRLVAIETGGYGY